MRTPALPRILAIVGVEEERLDACCGRRSNRCSSTASAPWPCPSTGAKPASSAVELGAVDERLGILDEPEHQADTDLELGSWERRHEEATRRRFRHVAARISAEVHGWHPHGVVLSGSSDDVAGPEARVDNSVADLVVGTLTLPMRAQAIEFAGAVQDIDRDLERRRERVLVEELHQRAPQGRKPAGGDGRAGRAAGGDARDRPRVHPGARRPARGHLGVAVCQCPECGKGSPRI